MSFNEWKAIKLGELCTLNYGKSLPAKKRKHGNIPVYSSAGITGYHNSPLVESEGIIIGRKGSVGTVHYSTTPFFCIDTAYYVLPSEDYNLKYLYYRLKSLGLENLNEDSAVPGLNRETAYTQHFLLPPHNEQKAIAEALSCLDDKIELNKRINKKLEEMAQAIFKSWFVDFEPFQDGEFEESELGRIPKGWRVGTLDDLISDTIGGDWGKEAPEGNYSEEVCCIRGADIPEIASGKKGNPPTRYILKKNIETKRLSEGQIIIEISGGSPTQSTGRTALITKELINIAEKPLICTNFCRALSVKKACYATFVYSMLQYLYNKDIFFLYENGTTGIKNLDINNLLNKHSIIIPNEENMNRYQEIFDTIINSIYHNGAEIDKLAAIRDTLLPRLMSGEMRVPIEEAGNQ